MKLFLLLASLLLMGGLRQLAAQDLIVTTQGDSLNCRIRRIESDYLHYSFMASGVEMSTKISRSEVRAFTRGYFRKSHWPESADGDQKTFPQWRVGLQGGWSRHTSPLSDEIPDELINYTEGLRNGLSLSADITHFITERLGIGVKASAFSASGEYGRAITIHPRPSVSITGSVSDHIFITFIGPTLNQRFFDRHKRSALITTLGLGYMNYRNTGFFALPKDYQGRTAALLGELGYDINFSKNFAIGLQLSYYFGFLRQLKDRTEVRTQTIRLERGDYLGLNRLDFSIGLRFNGN